MLHQVNKNMQVGTSGNTKSDYDKDEEICSMMDKKQESEIKEILKRIIDGNTNIPEKAKRDLKIIIETEHNPETLLQECLLYMMSYGQ